MITFVEKTSKAGNKYMLAQEGGIRTVEWEGKQLVVPTFERTFFACSIDDYKLYKALPASYRNAAKLVKTGEQRNDYDVVKMVFPV